MPNTANIIAVTAWIALMVDTPTITALAPTLLGLPPLAPSLSRKTITLPARLLPLALNVSTHCAAAVQAPVASRSQLLFRLIAQICQIMMWLGAGSLTVNLLWTTTAAVCLKIASTGLARTRAAALHSFNLLAAVACSCGVLPRPLALRSNFGSAA